MEIKNNFAAIGLPRVAVVCGLACMSLATSQVYAQSEDDSLIVDVAECVDIESAAERLACFESRVGETQRSRSAEPARGTATAAAAATAAGAADAESADEEVEMSRAERRALRRAERLQAEAEAAAAEAARQAEAPTQISATVTAVREVEPNMLLITLDNGQIWRQNRALRYRLEEGAAVTLRQHRWGSSYRLSDENLGGFILVERRR